MTSVQENNGQSDTMEELDKSGEAEPAQKSRSLK